MDRTLIYELKKPRSPRSGKIYVENENDWFLQIEFTKNKTGELTDRHFIIQKDLPGWLSYLRNSGGWEVHTVNEDLIKTFTYG